MADAEGDTDFEAFAAARAPALFRTALLLTGDRDSAEDLVQSTLERACRKWGRATAADSPEAYVKQIMVNLANDRWRRLVRRRESPLTHDRADESDPYRRTDERDVLVRTLHTLPIGMRTVLVLRYFDEMGDGEIADFMGISAATVRSQASRGMARLRAELTAGRGQATRASSKGMRYERPQH